MHHISLIIDDSSARFHRLQVLFENPLTEVNLLFYQSALQVFVQFNLFLQREYPLIPLIYEQIISFLTKLASTFLPVTSIREAREDLSDLEYANEESQLSGILVM